MRRALLLLISWPAAAMRELASRGMWQGWHQGDRKMKVKVLEDMLDELP